MRLKITLIAAFCCLFALTGYAHRSHYFLFTNGDSPITNNYWTLSGGTGESVEGNFIVTATGTDPIVFTRDKKVSGFDGSMPHVARAVLEYIYGTDAGTGSGRMVPKVTLRSEEGEQVEFTFPAAQDNLEASTRDTTMVMTGTPFTNDVRYIEVSFTGVQPGDMLVFDYIALQSDWMMPTVKPDKTIYIQAEDYDESWINGRQAYSTVGGGDNLYRPWDSGINVGNKDDAGFFSIWGEDFTSVPAWDAGKAIKNMCPNAADWNKYSGEYLEGNKISVESAIKNWGAFIEYTFDVPQECEADISLKVACHWGAYGAVSGGTTHWGGSRVTGGYTIDGMAQDWVKSYVSSWVASLDGENLRGAWSSHPVKLGDEETFKTIINDPEMWTNNQILKDGIKLNNDTVYAWPNPESMSMWGCYYKQDADFAKNNPSLNLPDYQNVHLTAGRHTLKIQGLAPMWFFDEMKIVGKALSGVEAVEANEQNNKLSVYPSPATTVVNIKGDVDEYSIIDLRSGAVVMTGAGNTADVSSLSAGVYAVKAGEKVGRFIKK